MRYFTLQFAPSLLLYKIWDIYLSNNIREDLFCFISCLYANETVFTSSEPNIQRFFFTHCSLTVSLQFCLLFVSRSNVPFNKKFPNLTKLSTERPNDYIMIR